MRSLGYWLIAGLILISAFACSHDPVTSAIPPAPLESERAIELLDNGRFDERVDSAEASAEQRLAWWRSSRGELEVRAIDEASADTAHDSQRGAELVLHAGQVASQPLAAFAPYARRITLRGRVEGRGIVTIVAGAGARARFEFESGDFTITGADIERALGSAPVPRFVLELSTNGDAPSRWRDLSALIPYPNPSRDALRNEVRARLTEIVDTWLARALDREGPRATGFAPHLFDACTGERLKSYPCGVHPLFESLLDLPEREVSPPWRAALTNYITAVLELGLQPVTGLPRLWDAEADVPLDEVSIEIAAMMRLLVDAADHGPIELRARCLAAARNIGDTVLAHGVLPDGAIAPIYRPRDAEPSTAAQPLRRLDLPAELCRLGALTKDERYVHAAKLAVAEFAFLHHWPGELERIDPGFDDDFGHYGARAVTMTSAYPSEAMFGDLARSGFARYAPLWRDAARAGASMAADQVRCWSLLYDLGALDPDVARAMPALVDDAVRAQLKGEQYDDGAWGDVTYWRFDPKSELEVGDLPGLPANLLRGLALGYGRTSRFTRDDISALFAGVLRSSVEHYGRRYGYLATRRERVGANDASGSLRLVPALVAMLAALER